MHSTFDSLNRELIACEKCPRLVNFRENVPEKHPTLYWKHPVPGFGDPNAQLLILGLAPSAQGGNRTGRIFTGDLSAKFLFSALHSQGFANQSTSEGLDDGLTLHNCYITAAVKCVPPKDKPLACERNNCFPYLLNEIHLLKNISAVLALGQFAFNVYTQQTKLPFSHGAIYTFENLPILFASYHPSPQNTHTGRLTQQMFTDLLKQIKLHLNKSIKLK